MIELLPWDTTFFKQKIGKTYISQLNANILFALIDEKEKEKYNLIYLFCDHVTPECDNIINNCGGILADIKVTYQKTVDQRIFDIPNRIEAYMGGLTTDLLVLAFASGHDSRFKKDPRLALNFNELYTQWIKNSLNGSMADAVFVYSSQGAIQGVVTVKKQGNLGQIGLIAVSELCRGKGVGSDLLCAAEVWYHQHNLHSCSVITQQANKQACSLYEKNGYSIHKSEIIYHI